jgi:hypothetical protein
MKINPSPGFSPERDNYVKMKLILRQNFIQIIYCTVHLPADELACFFLLKQVISLSFQPFILFLKMILPCAVKTKIGEYGINRTIHYQDGCLEMDNLYNSYGARDKENKNICDTNRVILLGDSFVEGFGVKENGRFSNLLEKETGKEMMNFSCNSSAITVSYDV